VQCAQFLIDNSATMPYRRAALLITAANIHGFHHTPSLRRPMNLRAASIGECDVTLPEETRALVNAGAAPVDAAYAVTRARVSSGRVTSHSPMLAALSFGGRSDGVWWKPCALIMSSAARIVRSYRSETVRTAPACFLASSQRRDSTNPRQRCARCLSTLVRAGAL